MRLLVPLLGLLTLAIPAQAAVKSATEQGFDIESSVTVAASPAAAYDAIGHIGAWWANAHTYSGDAANMTIELRAGGCFCEALPARGGSVEHARVVYVDPGRVVRMRGALGPAQELGVDGAFTWTLTPAANGGTTITARYVIGGYFGTDPRPLAPMFDRVTSEQLAALKAYIDAHPAGSSERRRP